MQDIAARLSEKRIREAFMEQTPSLTTVHQGHPMTSSSSVDEQGFRKLLSRNISLPLGMGVLSAVFFVSL
ncbi:hypothetical protein, partial [Pseudomonas fluorescens]|uniref:hypothetical protein n=1 Tax=Pseudomonas fluorescens TaxID=294 RepID=UPI001C83DFDC